MMSSIALGLQPSFRWPGSGGGSASSTGESTLGNARSAVSNSGVTGGFGDGFLLLKTTNVSLSHIGSTNSRLFGHSAMVDHGTLGSVSSGLSSRWLTQSGSFFTSGVSFGIISVSFQTSYGTIPTVQLGATGGGSAINYVVNLSSITTAGFSAAFSSFNTGGPSVPITNSQVTVYWESNGTVPR